MSKNRILRCRMPKNLTQKLHSTSFLKAKSQQQPKVFCSEDTNSFGSFLEMETCRCIYIAETRLKRFLLDDTNGTRILCDSWTQFCRWNMLETDLFCCMLNLIVITITILIWCHKLSKVAIVTKMVLLC